LPIEKKANPTLEDRYAKFPWNGRLETQMKTIVSAAMLVLTCSVLVGLFVALTNYRFEDCEPAALSETALHVASNTNAPCPTLAPPRGTVTLQIQTDHSELEVSWAEN
jgi:hypothetical protein